MKACSHGKGLEDRHLGRNIQEDSSEGARLPEGSAETTGGPEAQA